MNTVFDRNWFAREQHRLLWLLNHSTYFRRDLGIQECDLPHNVDITEITPNSFSWGDRYFEKDGEWFLERTTDFRGGNTYADRMYYAFYPVWNIAHKFDLSLANRYAPSLNLGFDTLTQYPGSIGTNNPFCARFEQYIASGEATWAQIRDGNGSASQGYTGKGYFAEIFSGISTNTWYWIDRSIFCFDTSTLTSGATISAATMSLYGSEKINQFSGTAPDINIFSAEPEATDHYHVTDFATLGTTAYATSISYADFSVTGYNVFTFNETGIGGISKTGITKLGCRNANYDVANTPPTWGATLDMCFKGYFNYTDSSRIPKLVVTYSAPEAFTLDLAETFTESDTITKFRGLKKTLSETITESDTITKSQAYKKTLTDNFTISEVNGVANGDSYALGGGTGAYVWGAANYAFGQSFTGSGETLRKVRFSLYKNGNPTGNCYAKIYAETHATAFGVDSVPTGSPMATSDAFDVANLPSDDFVWETFTFSGINNISLSSGTNYCVTFEYSGGDTSNRPLVECDYDIYSHTGNIVQYGGSWNSDNLGDTLFYIYGTPLTFATYLKSLAETFTQTEELVLSYLARKTLELIESIGMTDTVTKTQSYIKSLIDTFTQSDTITHLATWTKSLTESFSITDTLSAAKTYILNLAESIGLTDTITSMRSWILNLSESTSITDSLTTFATYLKSLIDTFTESDTITKAKSFFLNLTESIATFDTLTKLQGFVKTLDETFAVSDTLSRLGNYIKELTETFTESDAITTLKSVILSLSESIGLTDTITKVATYSKTFLESTSITDTLSAKANYIKSLSDSFTESDTVTKLLTRFLNLSESIGLTDTLTKVVTWIKNLSETTWMSEILKTSGNWWNELTKHSSTWTDGTKHSSSYTNSTKHTSSWTNRNKLS